MDCNKQRKWVFATNSDSFMSVSCRRSLIFRTIKFFFEISKVYTIRLQRYGELDHLSLWQKHFFFKKLLKEKLFCIFYFNLKNVLCYVMCTKQIIDDWFNDINYLSLKTGEQIFNSFFFKIDVDNSFWEVLNYHV